MHIFTRKHIAIFAAILCMSGIKAAEAPAIEWAKLFDGDTNAGDQSTAVAVSSNNEIYWLNTLGSTDAAPDCRFDGSVIFTGSPYSGTSYANNFALTKTDADGKEVWTVYSNSGDFASTTGGIATLYDGSVVFIAKVRHTDGYTDKPLCIVDAAGRAHEFGSAVEKRYYNLVLGKCDANGNISWLRIIDVDHGACPSGAKDFIADAVKVCNPVVDADGNIFIGGNFCMPLTFEKEHSTNETVTPRNTASWSGDAQKASGDMFIAKLDAEGYLLDCLSPEGAVQTTEQVLGLEAVGGKIYFHGLSVASDSAAPVTFGGKNLKASEISSPFVGCLEAGDMTVEWLTCLLGDKVDGKYGYQNSTISIVGSSLWLTSQFNGKYSCADYADKFIQSQQGTQREGMLVKFDCTDGSWLAAADSRDGFGDTGIGAYLAALQNPSHTDKVYVFGYLMNAAKGVFLRGYDATTLEADTTEDWSLVTGGGVPSACKLAYNPSEGVAYFTARGNGAFKPLGASDTAAPSKWAVCAAKVKLPDNLTSGIGNVSAVTSDGIEVSGAPGKIVIRSAQDANVTIYDLCGRVVSNMAVAGGADAEVSVEAGIYIAAGTKVLVK